jgi:hypothetical protein
LALEVSPDLRVLSFTFGLSLLAGLLFGIAPALQATKTSLNDSLQRGPKSIPGFLKLNPGKLFVLIEVALAIPLLVGAGLLIGTFQNLVTLDAGFVRENVLQVGINLEAAGYSPAQWGAIHEQIIERVGAIPGVAAASLANRGLIEEGTTFSGPLNIPGHVFHDSEPRDLRRRLSTSIISKPPVFPFAWDDSLIVETERVRASQS